MAKITVSLDKRHKRKDSTYPVVIRITHKSQVINLQTGVSVAENHWSRKSNYLSKRYTQYAESKAVIDNKLAETQKAVLKLESSNTPYTARQVKLLVEKRTLEEHTFSSFAQEQIDKQVQAGRAGNALTYKQALSSFHKYFREPISFHELTYKSLNDYYVHQQEKGLKTNAIAAYLRGIRAIYNKAIKEGIVERSAYPFDNFTIKHEATAKRAIPLADIKKIWQLELEPHTPIWDSRNYFILIFTLIGINFADLVTLTSDNIIDGRIVYRRKKTKKIYSIAITPLAQQILDIYIGKHSKFLLPILTEGNMNASLLKRKIKNKTRICNRYLSQIAHKCDITAKLTTYVARHSWATSAKKMGVSNEVIAQALGHEYGNKITGIYLDDFGYEVVDEVNQRLLDYLNIGREKPIPGPYPES